MIVHNRAGAVQTDPVDLELNIETAPTPEDSFLAAPMVSDRAGLIRGTTRLADREFSEPCPVGILGGKSVWMAWQAPGDGIVVFDTVGSSFDTLLAVYTGEMLDELVPVVGDDDSGGFHTSRTQFNTIGGEIYRIVVDGLEGAGGNYVLRWEHQRTEERAPQIVIAPGSRAVPAGASTTFSVETTSETNEAYQWYFESSPIAGATSSSYTVAGVVSERNT